MYYNHLPIGLNMYHLNKNTWSRFKKRTKLKNKIFLKSGINHVSTTITTVTNKNLMINNMIWYCFRELYLNGISLFGVVFKKIKPVIQRLYAYNYHINIMYINHLIYSNYLRKVGNTSTLFETSFSLGGLEILLYYNILVFFLKFNFIYKWHMVYIYI